MEPDIVIDFGFESRGTDIQYVTRTGLAWEHGPSTKGLLDREMLEKIFTATVFANLHPRGSVDTGEETTPYHFICWRNTLAGLVLDFYDGRGNAPVLTLMLRRGGFQLRFPDVQSRDRLRVVADTHIWPNKDDHWTCQFCTYQNGYAEGKRPLCEHCGMHPLQKVETDGKKGIDLQRFTAVTDYTGVEGEEGGVKGTEGNYQTVNGHLRNGTLIPSNLKNTFWGRKGVLDPSIFNTFGGLKGVLDPSIYSKMHFGVSVPLYSGQVSRGQEHEGSHRLVGAVKWFEFPAFTSTSAGYIPSFKPPGAFQFVFHWISKSGHDIRMLSERSFKENEILFDTGLILREIRRDVEGDITHIVCEEVRREGAAAAEAAAAAAAAGGGAGKYLAFPHANRSILALKVPQVLRF